MFSDPGELTQTHPKGGILAQYGTSLSKASSVLPGLGLSFALMLAAFGLARFIGGPVMLYAVALGMALNPFLFRAETEKGICFSAKTVLNIGVALLGVKIALIDIAALGWETAGLVLICVGGTILTGLGVGRLFKLKADHALIASSSVAICGASAAMAVSAALPPSKETEENTVLAVMGVTILSTAALILYPIIATLLGLTDTQAGLFIGATIHNVSQVVGAGFMISDPAGEVATIVKLMRVACLLPVIALITWAYRQRSLQAAFATGSNSTEAIHTRRKPKLVPGFLLGFVGFVCLNSLGLIPTLATQVLGDLSKYALVMAIGALGLKTSVRDLFKSSASACCVLLCQTALLATIVLAALLLVPIFA